MKHVLTIALLTGLVATSYGREPILAPPASVPVVYQNEEYSPTPISETAPVPAAPGSAMHHVEPGVIICDSCSQPPVPLCRLVKVRQERNIHPCAVSKIVSVPDPCNPCCCVFIEICVPPCGCECITYNRRGNSVKFDYGRYAVNVTARRGILFVNYDD